MATAEVLPLCAIAQIDNKFPTHRREIGLLNEDVLEKLSTIATKWMLHCEVEGKISLNRKCIIQSPQSSPHTFKESKKLRNLTRENRRLCFVRNQRGNLERPIQPQVIRYFLSNQPVIMRKIISDFIPTIIKKRECPLLDNPSLAVSVDLQSLDGQINVAQKKKQKSNKNNQKGKRNGDKAGQNKKHEEKDGSDEEDDTNNDANRDSGKKEDDDGNKDNHGNDKKDEKEDEEEDDVEKKADEDEDEKKEESEEKEKVEEDDDKNKEQEYSEESFYTITNSKKNKKTKSKKNGKNKAQPPEKAEVFSLNTSVNNDYQAFNDLETSGTYQESLILNANTMDGRDLDSSDNTIALDKKLENESLSSKVKSCEILKTTDSILLESRDNVDDGGTGSVLDDSQANGFVKNLSHKNLNASHTNELEKNTETMLSSIDMSNSDADRKGSSADFNSNHGIEETEKELGFSNSNAESFKIINKKGKKQKKQEKKDKKESQKSQASLKNKISVNDSESKLSIKNQELDLIQMPGAFSLDFLGNETAPITDNLNEMQSEIGVAPIEPTVENPHVEDIVTISQEVSQSNKLATEISLTPLNPSGDTEIFLTQDLTNESPLDKKNRTNSVDMKKMRNQKSFNSTKVLQEKVSEPNNINSDFTNDIYEPLNDQDENLENIALDKLIKSHSATFTDQKNPAIGEENMMLKAQVVNLDINSKIISPDIQPEHAESRKEKDKALDEVKMKKFTARAAQQAKARRKKETEAGDTYWETESILKADELVEFKNKEEIQTEMEAEDKTESNSIKGIECEPKLKAKALKGSKSRVSKQMKKMTGKERGKIPPLRDEDTVAAGAFHDKERNLTNNEPDDIEGDSNIDVSHQSISPTTLEESIAKLETDINKTTELQFNILDTNLEVATEARPSRGESTILNQNRPLEENYCVLNETHDYDKPNVALGKNSKSKSKTSKIEKKKKEGNVAYKLKSFEALGKQVTPLSFSKAQDVKEPQFSSKGDDFMISELSPMESTESKDVPGSFPQEFVDVNVEKIGGKKSKKKKNSKMKEDLRNLPMNGKIKHEDKGNDSETMITIKKDEQNNEQDNVDTLKVQHDNNEHEICPKIGGLEEIEDIEDLGKPEELDEPGELEKLSKLGELEKLEEPEELAELEKLKELGKNRELEKPDELEELGGSEKPEELRQLEEPGEHGNLELGEFKGIGEPENSNDYQCDETNFDETSALVLSQIPKNAPFYSLNLQPEVKTLKKKRQRNIRDGSPWGMLGVGPRKDIKRIAKRKSGDVKKVLRSKHTTPIKNPEKKELVKVSPPKRAEKTIRPPMSRGISSIFAAPIRSKSVAERRSSATRKPSSRRQSTSEAIGISSPFIGSGNKPEISLKAAKLLGVSPSPGIIPNKKAKINPVEYEDNLFESTKEDFNSPEKQSQNRKIKDDDDVIIESSGPSEPIMKRPESTRRTSIGGILSGLISSRSRPSVKRRSIATEEDSRSLRREDRKIKQSSRGISEVKMSGGLIDEDQKIQRLAQQTQEEAVNKNSDENLAAEKIQNIRKSRRSDRKVAEEAAERRAAELSQQARRARRSERKAAEEAIDKKMTEKEAAEIVQKARRARRAERKMADEIAERKAAEPAQKSRRAQRTERAELKTTDITPKKEFEKKEAAKKTITHRGSDENTRRTSNEERRERHRRKEMEQDERQNEEREARRAARRSQRAKEKEEKRGVESRHSKKNHAGEEKPVMDDRRKDESYLEKANYRNSISQLPEVDEEHTFRSKERRSSRAIPRDTRPKYEDLGLSVEYQKTKKSPIVKKELTHLSNEQDGTPWPDSMSGARAKERLKDPLITTSPLVPLFVKPKTSTEHMKHREARKSDSLKYDSMRYERNEKRRKRDSRIQENSAIPHASHGNERRSSHRNPNFVESRTPSAQGGFLSRWKRLAGV